MLHQNSKVFSETARRAIAAALSAALPTRRGLLAGTRVDTPKGWRAVEMLAAGDWVYTQDGTAKPLARVDHTYFEGRSGLESLKQAVLVPAGVLQNCAPFVALPDQHLLIDARRARAALRFDYALVPGRVLAGHLGIAPLALSGPLEVVTPCFEDEEAIWVNTGILVHCPAAEHSAAPPAGRRNAVLTGRRAEALLELLARPAGSVARSPFRTLRSSLPRRVKPVARPGARRRQAAALPEA